MTGIIGYILLTLCFMKLYCLVDSHFPGGSKSFFQHMSDASKQTTVANDPVTSRKQRQTYQESNHFSELYARLEVMERQQTQDRQKVVTLTREVEELKIKNLQLMSFISDHVTEESKSPRCRCDRLSQEVINLKQTVKNQQIAMETINIETKAAIGQLTKENKKLRNIMDANKLWQTNIKPTNIDTKCNNSDTLYLDGKQEVNSKRKQNDVKERISQIYSSPKLSKRNTGGYNGGIVAFYAILMQNAAHTVGETIKFNNTMTNIGGNYDIKTGVFTSSVTGTYVFSWSIEATGANYHYSLLVRNNSPIGQVLFGNNDHAAMGSQMVIAELDIGDRVWVKFHTFLEGSSTSIIEGRSTFSGFLLH